jgi:hypothetical protein
VQQLPGGRGGDQSGVVPVRPGCQPLGVPSGHLVGKEHGSTPRRTRRRSLACLHLLAIMLTIETQLISKTDESAIPSGRIV